MKEITIDFRNCEDRQAKMKECLLKLKEMGENVDTSCSSNIANKCNYICMMAGCYMVYIKPKDNLITYDKFLKENK